MSIYFEIFILKISFIYFKAFAIRYNCIPITQESNFDIFTQLSSLIDVQSSTNIGLYTLDFVDYILKHYNFQEANVWFALDNARHTQLNVPDLALWFTMDNEVNNFVYDRKNNIFLWFFLV